MLINLEKISIFWKPENTTRRSCMPTGQKFSLVTYVIFVSILISGMLATTKSEIMIAPAM